MMLMLISGAERRRAAEILAWSKAHPYMPGVTAIPGDSQAHAMTLPGGVRCVYSITIMHGIRYRHLSLSLEGRPRYVHPAVVREVAIQLFGFTTGTGARSWEPDPSWIVEPHEQELGVIVIAQPEESPS